MTSKTAAPHTLFELSLLLSALQKYGVDQPSFQKISTEFTQNDLISGDSEYDAARFTPDLLQGLYLQVLKDEVRAASQHAAQQAKRRKSPTPPLQNLDEARKHKHLLPGLVKSYYTKFVDEVTSSIQEDERAFDELTGEIAILEKQPKDEIPDRTVASAAQVKSGTSSAEHKNGILTRNEDENGQRDHSFTTGLSEKIANRPLVSTGMATATAKHHGAKDNITAESIPPQHLGTPSTSQVFPNHFKDGLFDQSAADSSFVFPSPFKDSTKKANSHHAPLNNTFPLQPYATPTHASNSTRALGTSSQQSPFFGSIQSATSNKLPNRGQLPPTFTPLPSKIFGHLTPSSNLNDRRLQGLPPINTSVSSTRWKDTPRNVKEGRSPPRPGNSPWLDESPSPDPESHDTGRQSSPEMNKAIDTPTRGRGRGRWANRGRGRVGRLPANSPGLRGRSQSTAMSGAEDSAAENISRPLKTEQPATPGFGDEPVSFVSTPGDSKIGLRRRDTIRDGETPKPNLKRKRGDTMDGGTPEVSNAPKFSRPGQILASRNFPRIVSALLNDINSHKLASVFAKPLTEKSAPGYLSLIYRPQDLKSIRSAIFTGSRFVATIPDPETATEDGNGGETSAAATPSTATTKVTNLWVERTAEVIPPKGIVNSAQLEKELCRMLANAVMYNPDPKRGFGPNFRMTSGSQHVKDDSDAEMEDEDDLDDGRLVNDAREMFASVEQAVAAWRAAERINAGDNPSGSKGALAVVGEKSEEINEDGAENNTGTEDAAEEKSGSLRRSTRG